jgi:hypothetical protein
MADRDVSLEIVCADHLISVTSGLAALADASRRARARSSIAAL